MHSRRASSTIGNNSNLVMIKRDWLDSCNCGERSRNDREECDGSGHNTRILGAASLMFIYLLLFLRVVAIFLAE